MALKYYKGYEGNMSNNNQLDDCDIYKEFQRLKSLTVERKRIDTLSTADLCKFPTTTNNANPIEL